MTDIADRLRTGLADQYRLVRQLGAGGMATVYLAEDLKHHRLVAVKVLRPELTAAIGPERFLREIGVAAHLQHPHILPLFDSGHLGGDAGIFYYVMPFVEGESLRDRIRGALALEAPNLYDGRHMSSAPSRRPVSSRKEASHERIVETAARAIRRSGYGGAGVAEIMKEAGLTHGGFYAHFESREGMLAEAADRAGADGMAVIARVAAAAPPKQALEAMLRSYLSKEHVEAVETGCAVAALGSEMPRQTPKVRRAATRRIKEMIDLVARQAPDWGQPGAHDRALVTVATALGALVLARAVDDPKLSDAVREAALNHLTPAG